MKSSTPNTRRQFITDTAKAAAYLTLGSSAVSSVLTACKGPKLAMGAGFSTAFTQQPLPYSYDALETVIDQKTMEIHYSKHAAAYSTNLRDAIKAENVTSLTVEDILKNISKYSIKMRNNAGGHYNHEMYWQSMQPAKVNNAPTASLLEGISKAFGSFDAFKVKFAEAAKAQFGSGWAWLYVDNNKKLQIGSTANQDNPLMNVGSIKGFPVLGIDIWEHAYYLKYQNKRADYIENWWKVINWNYIATRWAAVGMV